MNKKDKPYNPLDKVNLAKSIDAALISQDPTGLNKLIEFPGAGLYALYYKGRFPAYAKIASVNKQSAIAPIYVGKAEASGKRKGGFLASDASGTALYKRLSDHAKSISQANNLNIDDFLCRYLVVDETWIALGESMLISKYAPLWNARVDGFGNHNPGKGRNNGARPKWDMIHPGRPWADGLKPNPISVEKIYDEIEKYLTLEFPPNRLLERSHYEYGFISLNDRTE